MTDGDLRRRFAGPVSGTVSVFGQRLAWAACVLLWAGVAQAQTTVQVTDDTHHTLTLAHPLARVISAAPSLTELLYEAGAGERLVGTVDYSDYPTAARKVPRIGSNQKLDLERIARMKPDLALVWFHGNATREVEQLAALGVPMFYLEPQRIQDIPSALERIGHLMGTSKIAQAAAQRFRARYDALRTRYAGRAPVRVFYQVEESPLLTVNDKQLISDVIHLCGGINVFGQASMLVPQLSTESVVTADPEVILTSRWSSNGGGSSDAVRAPEDRSFRMWARFSTMKAVKAGQLWLIPGDQISRHGPRILDAAQALCAALDEARRALIPGPSFGNTPGLRK
jgi:iron complex transport system substrate-binding protein